MHIDILGLSVAIAGIIIGIVVAYYFYRKGLRTKGPCWAIRSNNLIQGYSAHLENLLVRYNKVNVKNLTISKILFWNAGAETINKSDIGTVNHVRIVCLDGAELLDAKVLKTNNQSCQFTTELDGDKTSALLNFDYLDKSQGAIIQVVHTGTSSANLNLIGDIKGVEAIKNKYATPKWVKVIGRITIPKKLRDRVVSVFAIFSGIYYVLSAISQFFYPLLPQSIALQSIPSATSRWISLILLSLSGILMIYMGTVLWKQVGIAPKGLDAFYDD